MTRQAWHKYLAFARIAAALARAEPGELLGRALFFPLLLGIFSALWRAVGEAGMPLGTTPATLVWYLAVTEWVLLGSPLMHLEIEQEVRRGEIAYHLPRPSSYVLSCFARGLGALAVRSPLLGTVGFACAFAYSGGLPAEPRGLCYALPLGVVAQIVLLAFNLTIGLLAFWLQSVSPVYWIWQKSAFVLGGLMLPLELYPALVQRLARFTPFPSILYGPGRFVLGAPSHHAALLALSLSGWLTAALLLASAVYARALRTLAVNGG
jgi:ABC-2 type transport system permease protein